MNWNKLIIDLRTHLLLSQTEMAWLLNVSFASVNRWENAHCEPTIKSQPFQFVINNKLYDLGVCTYTWYNNTAKRMMAKGSNRINGNYDLLIYDKTIDQGDVYGWNHYHLGERKGDKVERIEERPYSWAHSFFGLLYINTDGNYTTYPVNP